MGSEMCIRDRLQVTVCIFRLNYALHLTVKGLMVCTFSEGFRMNCRFFEISMLRTRLPDAFHLVQNDNCHCQTLSTLKNAKFDLFGSEKKPAGKSSGFEQRLVHCDSTIGYGMQNTIYESLVLLIR